MNLAHSPTQAIASCPRQLEESPEREVCASGILVEETDMAAVVKPEEGSGAEEKAKSKKVIKGNLPYTPAPGVFKKTLEGIITAGQPERFTSNFMETVLGVAGGSSRYVPPLLKKMGFLTSDGTPTDLYISFRTEGSRSAAAFTGLKS